jgi:hypothetical protein
MGILIFKGLTARRLYKPFSIKGLIFTSFQVKHIVFVIHNEVMQAILVTIPGTVPTEETAFKLTAPIDCLISEIIFMREHTGLVKNISMSRRIYYFCLVAVCGSSANNKRHVKLVHDSERT